MYFSNFPWSTCTPFFHHFRCSEGHSYWYEYRYFTCGNLERPTAKANDGVEFHSSNVNCVCRNDCITVIATTNITAHISSYNTCIVIVCFIQFMYYALQFFNYLIFAFQCHTQLYMWFCTLISAAACSPAGHNNNIIMWISAHVVTLYQILCLQVFFVYLAVFVIHVSVLIMPTVFKYKHNASFPYSMNWSIYMDIYI